MKAPRIYTDQSLTDQHAIDLNENASSHVGRVLRMKAGDALRVFNGEGGQWLGQIEAVSKKTVTVQLREFMAENNESPLQTHLGQVLSRGERMDYAIQKATEMGVTQITPLFSERCEVKLQGDRIEKRLAHWQQIAISACEQCGRNIVPIINSPQKVSQWIIERDEELKFVLHHRTEKQLTGFDMPCSVALFIGPEGGLTAQEIEQAQEHQFYPLSLGPRVLRTETAPIAVLALLQHYWGDK